MRQPQLFHIAKMHGSSGSGNAAQPTRAARTHSTFGPKIPPFIWDRSALASLNKGGCHRRQRVYAYILIYVSEVMKRILLVSPKNNDNTTQHNATQHDTTQYNPTQPNTTQHITAQHNTTRHNTNQHNTTHHNTKPHNTTQRNATQRKREQGMAIPSRWVDSSTVCPPTPSAV